MQQEIEQKAKELYPDNMGGLDQKAIGRYRAGYIKGFRDAKIEHPGSIGWVKGQYGRLYDQVKGGKRTVCYVDYDRDLGIRDICDIDPENMCLGVRGRGYGDPDYYSGMDEKAAFIMICENINVEWLDEFDWSKISKEQDLADGKELTAYYAEIERCEENESNEQPELKDTVDVDELWDEHSALIGDDIDDLSFWSGRTVMKKEDFVKAIETYQQSKNK